MIPIVPEMRLKLRGEHLRKLSIVQDPEAKARIIAILDYWTQTALKPLSDAQFSILKGIKTDYTFNQGGFSGKIPNHVTAHSLDLTACTDRLPVCIQEILLAHL
jgi:hypothetical protein